MSIKVAKLYNGLVAVNGDERVSRLNLTLFESVEDLPPSVFLDANRLYSYQLNESRLYNGYKNFLFTSMKQIFVVQLLKFDRACFPNAFREVLYKQIDCHSVTHTYTHMHTYCILYMCVNLKFQ